jgi:PIN domain nuclease of toxin-antitoxin system
LLSAAPKRLGKTPTVSDFVVDSSAALAVALRERGWEEAQPLLIGSMMCVVNAAEVVSRYLAAGVSLAQTQVLLARSRIVLEPLDPERAMAMGALHRQTRSYGLSLGDCACLALARSRGLPALTADRAWARLDLGVQIKLIR